MIDKKTEGCLLTDMVELFLGDLAFNSNYPIIYKTVEKIGSKKELVVGSRVAILPMGDTNYYGTLSNLIENVSEYNRLFLLAGIDFNKEIYQEENISKALQKYIIDNKLEVKTNDKNSKWFIYIDEAIIQKLLKSDKRFFLEDGYDFVNHFHVENFMQSLHKSNVGNEKKYQKVLKNNLTNEVL